MNTKYQTVKGAWAILKALKQVLRPHLPLLCVAIILMILVDLTSYALPLLVSHVTDTVLVRIQEEGAIQELLNYGLIFLAFALGRGAIVYGMIHMFWAVAERVSRDLRGRLFEKLQNLEAQFYDRARTGDLMSRITNDVQVVRNFFAYGLEHRIRIVLITATIFFLMLAINWKLTLLVYLMVPVIMVAMSIFGRKLDIAVKEKHSRLGRVTGYIQENLRSIRIVKSFGAEEDQIQKFTEENDGLYQADSRVYDLQAKMNPMMGLANTIGTLVIVVYGGMQIVEGSGDMSLGVLLGFLNFLAILGFPIVMLAGNASLVSLTGGAAQRILEVLKGPDQRLRKHGKIKDPISGRIRFDKVSFSYTPEVTVLEKVNFDIRAGEHVAIFGLTGSGKSSLISLIPRFYEPNSGRILVDEKAVHEYDLDYLRSQMGLVLQESFLFSLSILDNIRYGRPDASMDQVIRAAKAARIHDTVMELPQGYDTVLGEFGTGLSGGQRQRVAIARAILKDPQILILDDCTSSLDAATEREIQEELQTLMQGRTALIIAQKFPTLKLADRIIFLHEGTVAHVDSHDELLKKSPLYNSLYEAQAIARAVPDGFEWRTHE